MTGRNCPEFVQAGDGGRQEELTHFPTMAGNGVGFLFTKFAFSIILRAKFGADGGGVLFEFVEVGTHFLRSRAEAMLAVVVDDGAGITRGVPEDLCQDVVVDAI